MGLTQSNTSTSIDIANEFITNISTSVLTKNSTTSTSDQLIDIRCTDAAFIEAVRACNQATLLREELVLNNPNASPEMLKSLLENPPSACTMCSAENINLEMNTSINISAVADNTIANGIKAEIQSKLKEMIDNKTSGGIGLTQSNINALTKLKNYTENNFNTNIVNETLNTFSFKQELKGENMKFLNINMKLVGTAISNALIQNAIKNDSEVKQLIEASTTLTSDTKGTNPLSFLGDLFNSEYLYGIIGIIALILVGYLFMKFKPSQSYYPQPYYPQQNYPQQNYQEPYYPEPQSFQQPQNYPQPYYDENIISEVNYAIN